MQKCIVISKYIIIKNHHNYLYKFVLIVYAGSASVSLLDFTLSK